MKSEIPVLNQRNCVSCNNPVAGNYCARCGQRAHVKRITMREGWNDFWARVYGFDGMFPRTLRDLTIRPGIATQRFLDGNRVAYYGPVGYFFLMITLLYLLASLLNVDMVELLKNNSDTGLQSKPETGSGQDKFMQTAFRVMSDNLKLVAFTIIPVQAFVSRFIFFRKSGLNFTEHTVLPFYCLGHLYWVSIVNLFIYKASGAFLSPWIQMVISSLFFCHAYADLFRYQSRLKAFFKGFGVYITTQLLYGFLIAGAVVILIVVYPEVFEALRPSNNP